VHALARQGIDDLLQNWWIGSDSKSGHIKPTFCGISPPNGDQRGQVWERAEMIFAIEGLYHMDADINLKEILKSQWYYDKLAVSDPSLGAYTEAEWESCGSDSRTGLALDDATWKLRYLLIAYEMTGDPDALKYARNLITNIYSRWWDATSGGLWYSDARKEKNLVGAAFSVAALKLYELDPVPASRTQWWKYASNELDWIESKLSRNFPAAAESKSCNPAGPPADGLYWMSYGQDIHNGNIIGIDGGECPGDWRPDFIENGGGSVSSFMGVTAMNVARSLQYQNTGEAPYFLQAVANANAIGGGLLVDGSGAAPLYKNDRDAFVDGSFGSMWARNALVYGGMPLGGISEQVSSVMRNTAESIAANSRQLGGAYPAGSYRGDWSKSDVWSHELMSGCTNTLQRSIYTSPDILMVSASTVGMLVGASYLP
jgi:hypothetical protein